MARPAPKRKAGGGVSFQLDGVEELAGALAQVRQGVRVRVIRAGMRRGMDVITEQTRANAPVRTGRLRATIRTVNGKTNSKWKVRVETRVGAGDFKGTTFYAGIVEFGSKRSRPHPFMTPAYDARRADAVRLARAAILAGVDDEVYAAAFRKTTIGRAYTRASRAAGRFQKSTSRRVKRARKVGRRTAKRAAKAVRRRSKAIGKRARKAFKPKRRRK